MCWRWRFTNPQQKMFLIVWMLKLMKDYVVMKNQMDDCIISSLLFFFTLIITRWMFFVCLFFIFLTCSFCGFKWLQNITMKGIYVQQKCFSHVHFKITECNCCKYEELIKIGKMNLHTSTITQAMDMIGLMSYLYWIISLCSHI